MITQLYKGKPPITTGTDTTTSAGADTADTDNGTSSVLTTNTTNDTDTTDASESNELYVRVKCNFHPFFDRGTHTVTATTVQEANMVTLKDYKVSDLKCLIEKCRQDRLDKGLLLR